ncbi:inner membrane protein [alpha proteobacterium U9-1i]|nr:inner membrane protein [alpha proteobacterium U9-1i]
MKSARTISTPAVIGAVTISALAIVAYGFATNDGWNEEGAGAAARLTARFSFPIFVLAWSASALARLWPGGWRSVVLRRRRAIGLSFAAAHFVHLGALLIAVLVFGDQPKPTTVFGGGAGYVLIAAMALTSNDAAVRAMGPRNWKLLHAVGGYAIATIFAVSYLGRVETNPALGVPAMILIGAAALLRLAAWLKSRTPRAALQR